VDFKNTLLIMTSNVGSSVIEKGGGQLGFQLDVDQVCPAAHIVLCYGLWQPQ
jgi:ATP-dependent Clp protease ATP-binding subunit ClpA